MAIKVIKRRNKACDVRAYRHYNGVLVLGTRSKTEGGLSTKTVPQLFMPVQTGQDTLGLRVLSPV